MHNLRFNFASMVALQLPVTFSTLCFTLAKKSSSTNCLLTGLLLYLFLYFNITMNNISFPEMLSGKSCITLILLLCSHKKKRSNWGNTDVTRWYSSWKVWFYHRWYLAWKVYEWFKGRVIPFALDRIQRSGIQERLQSPADGCRAAHPDCGFEHGFLPLKMFHLQIKK